ncbi:transmembrane protein FAM155A-like [Amphibalanus amphitrite]|uniref:transmembrane protein FAM155A-like n=1 Tax=Amphibalanus amphitrite TaxID=1232801 RepID=UPI001C918889|nr:transmembrane protein FAM155A-like [Amphibalanus amphitrite]
MAGWLAARLDAQLGDLSQRWRRCLASLLLFTIILTNNFGVSSSRTDVRSGRPRCPAGAPLPLPQCLEDSDGRSATDPTGSPPLPGLNSCCQINFYDALNCTASLSDGRTSQDCRERVKLLQERDRLVEMHYANFVSIVDRLDCTDTYSVIYTCSQCKEAYHDWLCAMYVPFCGSEGRRLRPCRSHCQRVQRVCPFFLPSERKSAATQYAGEPAFFCDDPDIPDIPPFTTGSTYGDPDCCYHSCCVRPDQPECSADTCSAAAACPGQAGPPPPPPPAAPASAGAWAVRFNQLQRHSPAAKGPAWLGLGPAWLGPGPVSLGQGPVFLGQGPA